MPQCAGSVRQPVRQSQVHDPLLSTVTVMPGLVAVRQLLNFAVAVATLWSVQVPFGTVVVSQLATQPSMVSVARSHVATGARQRSRCRLWRVRCH